MALYIICERSEYEHIKLTCVVPFLLFVNTLKSFTMLNIHFINSFRERLKLINEWPVNNMAVH